MTSAALPGSRPLGSPVRSIPDEPPAHLRYRRPLRPTGSLSNVWRSRELILTLAERDLRVRFKQATLGFAWAIVTPLVMMIVFSVFFNRVAHVKTGGPPYVLFSYVGLLAWSFFASSVSSAGDSLLSNLSLLSKVFFPREVFPIAGIVVSAVNTMMSVVVLGLLFAVEGYAPRGTSFWVVPLVLIQLAVTVGAALLVSIITVYLRDLRHAMPLVVQLGLFATPVAYPIKFAHGPVGVLYHALNPMSAVIDGFRNSVLLGRAPDTVETLVAMASSVTILFLGLVVFRRMEPGIVDVA